MWVRVAPRARTTLVLGQFRSILEFSIFILEVLKLFRDHCSTRFFALITNMASNFPYDLEKIRYEENYDSTLIEHSRKRYFWNRNFSGFDNTLPLWEHSSSNVA